MCVAIRCVILTDGDSLGSSYFIQKESLFIIKILIIIRAHIQTSVRTAITELIYILIYFFIIL